MSDPERHQTSHGPGSAQSGDHGQSTVNNYYGYQQERQGRRSRGVHLPQRKAGFIGREEELATLKQQLELPGSLAVICNVPGRGKTTLALEFAHRDQDNFDSVHWVPCNERSLAQIADELAFQAGIKPEGDTDSLVRELNSYCARRRCLLILDNVENETPAPLLASAGRASALITTRIRNLAFVSHGQWLQLPLFTEEECFQLFRSQLGKDEVDGHAAAARSIFRRLEYLPIGISVSAGLLRHDPLLRIVDLARNLPADVYALIGKAVAALSPEGRSLLAAMAVCAPGGFLLALAQQVAGDEARTATRELYLRSLVELIDKDSQRYRVHAMVRDAAGATDELRSRHAAAVQRQFQTWEADWKICAEEMADFQVALAWLLSRTDDVSWEAAKELASSGFRFTYRSGRLGEGYEIWAGIIAVAAERKDNWCLQASYGNQALILQAWGQLDEALDLHKKQEAICLELGNREGLQASYGNQAVILKAWGRLDEALDLHKKEEAICVELGSRDGLQISYGNQALILQAWGQLDEALDLHKKEEAICLELGNRDGLAASYGNQALILQVWGRLEEAIDLHKKQEAICLELGNRNSLRRSYGNQALILQVWGRLDDALDLHKEEEAICLELGNRDGLQLSYGNQALILQAWGQLDEALHLHKKKEAICLELGNRNSLQASYGNQALILKAWGRLDEALDLLKKQEAICVELGNDNGLQISYGNQALILKAWGQLDEALDLHKKEEAICLELGNRDGLQASYGNQALILKAWGRLDEALDLQKKEEAICLELGNRDGLQRSYGNQALILQAWGRLDEALDLHKKKEAICLELGNRNGLAQCYANWGFLARGLGDFGTARHKFEQARGLFAGLGMHRELDIVRAELEREGSDASDS